VPVDLKSKIRDIPDFPKRGIVFKDIMPLLADPEALHETVEQLGGVVVGLAFVIELEFLHGREKLDGYDVCSLIKY
jgi:adenine phosphoribosyltransferase